MERLLFREDVIADRVPSGPSWGREADRHEGGPLGASRPQRATRGQAQVGDARHGGCFSKAIAPREPTMTAPARDEALPSYDALQSTFHDTFRDELYAIVDSLPLGPDAHALDVPCGDGFYAARLAARLAGRGRLTLADASTAYLDEAGTPRLRPRPARDPAGRGRRLPPSVRRRLVRPGLVGREPHQSGRPRRGPGGDGARGPARRRPRRAGGGRVPPRPARPGPSIWNCPSSGRCRRRAGRVTATRDLRPRRRVRHLLLEAGLTRAGGGPSRRTGDAPFSPEVRSFLRRHLKELGEFIHPHLTGAEPRAPSTASRRPARAGGVFDRHNADLTCINVVHVGRKPAARPNEFGHARCCRPSSGSRPASAATPRGGRPSAPSRAARAPGRCPACAPSGRPAAAAGRRSGSCCPTAPGSPGRTRGWSPRRGCRG